MKKLLSLLLALSLALLTLSSCTGDTVYDIPNSSDELAGLTLPPEKEISYPESYPALEEIEYDVSGILDTAQIENKLYILKSDGVYMVDLADGSESLIFEKDGLRFLTSDEEQLYACDRGSNIYTLGADGSVINTQQIPEGTFESGTNFDVSADFIATDDYFVIACFRDKKPAHTYISKSDMSVTISEESMDYVICPYEGNRYWVASIPDDYGNMTIFSYDIDTGKAGYSLEPVGLQGSSAMAYDRYSGKLIFYNSYTYGMMIVEFDPQTLSVKQVALYSQDFKSYVSDEHITAYGNLYCAVSGRVDGIKVYDTNKAVTSLHVVVTGGSRAEVEYLSVILSEKYNINVSVSVYTYSDMHLLPLKIMAQDSDIDILYDIPNLSYYIISEYFVDLNQFDVLKENIAACKNLLDNGFSYEGKIFGVPFVSGGAITIDCMQLYGEILPSARNSDAYCAKYIDLVNKEYKDDGDVLYELLLHNYKNRSSDPIENMADRVVLESLCDGVKVISDTCYMINPASENQEEAAIFINEIMNMALGRTYDDILEYNGYSAISYYDLDLDYSSYYPSWRYDGTGVGEALSQVMFEARYTDDEKDIRRLADECYNKIRQAIME